MMLDQLKREYEMRKSSHHELYGDEEACVMEAHYCEELAKECEDCGYISLACDFMGLWYLLIESIS